MKKHYLFTYVSSWDYLSSMQLMTRSLFQRMTNGKKPMSVAITLHSCIKTTLACMFTQKKS